MRILAAFAAILAAALVLSAAPARAQVDQQQTVNRALATIERLKTDKRFQSDFVPQLAQARAALIVPDLYKGGFILGGQFGNGVLLARGSDGNWSYPCFYSLAGGSLGLQFGLEDVSIVFLIKTDRGLDAVLQDQFKIGAEMQVALAVVGGGTEAATTSNMHADILAYALGAVGFYGSVSLEGAALSPRESWNSAYYGHAAGARAIILQNAVRNPQADRLRDFLAK